ncbi:MAG TPA: zinc ribbon domain-containing protein [Actinomycetota bacterium]|nr:zinc ribbon domain-containing protein [Actinomycetota bacterium]
MTPLGAASAGTTCPACGIGAPAEARFCPACGERLLGDVAWLQDDLDAAEGFFGDGNRLSLEIGFTRKRLWSLLGLVQVAIARDRPEEARRLAREAIALTTEPDGTTDVEAELHLAEACLAGADLGEAAAATARAWAVLQDVDVFSRARLQRTEARLAAAGQATDRATIMGANALLRRLQRAGEPAGGGVGT